MSASSAGRSAPADPASVEQMREHWRRFAREDAMYYVATNQEAWTAADFYSVGKDFVADAVAWAGPGIGRSCAVEIGCGAGRMLVHLASEFDRVEGFDIAPEMIEIARAHVPHNVNTTASSGAGLEPLPDDTADFLFCAQVFQHIPDPGVVDRYVSETARVLRPGGRAMLHFDTRHDSLVRRAAMALPDFLLPRNRRRFIRRYPLPAGWPAERAVAAGLTVVDERGRGTVEHMLLAEKSA